MDKELQKLIVLNPKISTKTEIIGSIYALVNKINGKIYIGKTIQAYTTRWREHYCNAVTKNLPNYLYRAIRKYSWENFDKVVIFQTDVLDKNSADAILIEKERFYINLFRTDSSEFGYNLTKGGDGVVGIKFTEETRKQMSKSHLGEKHWNFRNFNNSTSIPILQFDLDGNLLKEWPSMNEVSRELGFKSNNISRCCSNKLDSYKGFIWVKKEDYFEGYLQKYKSRVKCKSNDKVVLQFDLEGNLLNSYISASEASRCLNKKNPSMINKAAAGTERWAYKYIWIYEQDFTEDLLKNKLKCIQDYEG